MNIRADIPAVSPSVPSAIREWLSKDRPLLIDGKWVPAQSGKTFEVTDPATGEVVARTPQPDWEVVRISLPSPLSRYVVEKGSITVDGISLTVSGLGPDWFEVSLIPTTLSLTTLGTATVGTPVNLEVDVIAKYVERLLGQRAQ